MVACPLQFHGASTSFYGCTACRLAILFPVPDSPSTSVGQSSEVIIGAVVAVVIILIVIAVAIAAILIAWKVTRTRGMMFTGKHHIYVHNSLQHTVFVTHTHTRFNC